MFRTKLKLDFEIALFALILLWLFSSCTEGPTIEERVSKIEQELNFDPPGFTPEQVAGDTLDPEDQTDMGVLHIINWQAYNAGIDSTFTLNWERGARRTLIGKETGAVISTQYFMYGANPNKGPDNPEAPDKTWIQIPSKFVVQFYLNPEGVVPPN